MLKNFLFCLIFLISLCKGDEPTYLAPYPNTVESGGNPPLTEYPNTTSNEPNNSENYNSFTAYPANPTYQQQKPQDDFETLKLIADFNLKENGDKRIINNYAQRNEYQTEPGVCFSINIVNNISEFQQLQNCNVIEGFLNILTVVATEKDFEELSFPNLKEITDYLSVVEVFGLKSLGKLFPNLSIIRGNNQFLKGYSLIVVENPHLEDIGLNSLTHIGRGAVRINNNPKLCYADTIDWSLIATHTSHPFHYIMNNKPSYQCEPCPEQAGSLYCYTALTFDSSFFKDGRRLCWNKNNCQKICPAVCKDHGCDENFNCCHSSCLGGCTSVDSINTCTACKYYKFNDVCMRSCPDNYYKLNDRRCVSYQECRDTKRPLNIFNGNRTYDINPYFTNEDMCVMDCPPNHQFNINSQIDPMMNYYTNKPKSCQAHRESDQHRYCNGVHANTTNHLRELEGCTHIRGSLYITIEQQTQSTHNEKLYEKYFGNIQEIEGHLAIVGTPSMKSLHAFKNLRTIMGKTLHNGKYALFLLYNENLELLFFIKQNVEIYKGSLFIAMNPSLCDTKIRRFQQSVTEISGSCCDTVVIGNDEDC